ncbi:amidase [Acidovorax temperans]|uniref:Amidase n=1 Tax=Acidovorax temperans TaxID=80878 RepID=A0A543KWP4_9BURK|nr:amidase [Acidovorax temperans]TQM99487.1 amidase [Acidovorax temperans]
MNAHLPLTEPVCQPFPITDTVGAWVPHGRFTLAGQPGGPLAGLRFAAKDLFDVAGNPTGAGNPTWLATHPVPTAHSPVVAQLLQAGATLMGKVITDELAYSLHGDNAHYGTPLNSRYPGRVTGGSSSGSAAAVAAGLVDFALGTDTGGSTRVPASYCGLWGLRTTHGLLSGEGLVPLHPRFDTPTWLTSDGAVFERVGQVLLPASRWRATRLLLPLDAWALADELFAEPLARARDALAALIGAPPQDLTIAGDEGLGAWRQTYATAGAFEGWQVHGPWITQALPVFAPAIAARWQAASQVTAEAAATARAAQGRISEHVRGLLGDNGLILLPSAASLAPLRDADPASVDAIRLRTMAITCIAGLSGLPQVSLPVRTAGGDTLGLSLLGPAGSDLALIGLARRLHAQIA